MKIGIFSDVHSNLAALQAVIDFYKTTDCEKFYCLGDVVGYGPHPDECCNIVKNFADLTVLGNHDAAVCKRMNYAYYYDAAKNVLDYHASLLSKENMEWLKNLSYLKHFDSPEFTICHGSPINEEEFNYVFSIEQAESLLEHFDELKHITFIGHSHLTKAFAISHKMGAVDITNSELILEDNQKYIITVGSVGQPRDYDNRACCTIFDTENMTVRYERIPYDVMKTLRDVFESEKIAYNFGKRLILGI